MDWEHSASDLKGSETKAPKKVSHVTVKHAANGGHIITHHHTHPTDHEDEQHTTKGDAAMLAHLQQAMPDQNPPAADPNAAAGAPPDASAAGAPPDASAGATPAAPGL